MFMKKSYNSTRPGLDSSGQGSGEPSIPAAMTELLPEERLRKKIHIRNPLLRNALSEFFGTALLLFIGLSIVMQFILSGEKLNTWIQINIGWGLAIAFCVYACSKTSGGHFNPAVSFAMFTLGRLSLRDFLVYCLVQTIGAFFGAIGAFGIYYDQFVKYAGTLRTIVGPRATAACFCSFPAAHLSNLTCFFDQVAGTGLLLFFVVVIIDRRNGIPAAAHPFLFGFVLVMIGEPCEIFIALIMIYHNYYFWIPIIAPFFGAALAAWSYHIFIGAHIPDPVQEYVLDEVKQPLKSA
ncbi:channel protein, MIP family [Teladorsagia circumcincta]|uniref:Channel protein, MIP family n=1 Tax=Teladorsagia circumcincta TaxID=45464 RepID=A0A2G9TW78_TELCI|nr:channel protein, MIP family [Teladorsagia circumcincta]